MKKAPDPWAVLDEWPALTYKTACELLSVKARQLRALIAAGKLERVGQGHQRKVTSISVRRYGGFVAACDEQKSGTIRQKAAVSGSKRQSRIYPD